MKVVTLEQVKDYFKNAKEVKCISDGTIHNISNLEIRQGVACVDSYFAFEDNFAMCEVYRKNKGFAEIKSKNDFYNVPKQFILDAHEAACSSWKTKIEKQFPEVFPKIKLEIGEWYKVKAKGWTKDALVYFDNNEGRTHYGFNHTGRYGNLYNNLRNCLFDEYLEISLADEYEVANALIDEAKKRGFYNDGVTFKSEFSDFIWTKTGNISIEYTDDTLKLWSDISETKNDNYKDTARGHNIIFKEGVWAEIVSTPVELTLEQIAEKFNISVEQIKIKK